MKLITNNGDLITFSSNNMIKYGMKKVSQKVFKRGPRDIYFKELD